MIMKLYAITDLSQAKTFFMMMIGAETHAGESHRSSPQNHLFPKGPTTSWRPMTEREDQRG
jgi:hypothetical protein